MPKPQQAAENPVVLLSAGIWHIVESSRESRVALCGRPISERQAHSRLQTIGREHACSACLKVFEQPTKRHP